MDRPPTFEERIKSLEAELRRERAISAVERRRSELLESSLRLAYKTAFAERAGRSTSPRDDS
jgi:hypothetical protein